MPLYHPANKQEFERLFIVYKQAYDQLMAKEQDRLVVLFNVRFRLTLGKRIQFDDSYSYTKTKNVKDTYRLLMRLNDAWFAYEALLALCEQEGKVKLYKRKNKSYMAKPESFDSSHIQMFKLLPPVVHFNKQMAAYFFNKLKRMADLERLLQHLEDRTKGNTNRLVEQAKSRIQQVQQFDLKHILAIIYSIRNLYVHQGDAARSGVKNYTTKLALLKMAYDFLILLITKVGTRVMNDKTKKLSKAAN